MVSQEQIGMAIIRLRKRRGLSQEKFALESGIDRRYLSDIENGKRNVSFELLNRVANYFKVTLSSFIVEAEHSGVFNNVDELREYLIEHGHVGSTYFTNPEFLDAIVGVSNDGRLAYSYIKMVDELMLTTKLSYEEAVEFIEYNTLRTLPFMGDKCPIILNSID